MGSRDKPANDGRVGVGICPRMNTEAHGSALSTARDSPVRELPSVCLRVHPWSSPFECGAAPPTVCGKPTTSRVLSRATTISPPLRLDIIQPKMLSSPSTHRDRYHGRRHHSQPFRGGASRSEGPRSAAQSQYGSRNAGHSGGGCAPAGSA